MQNAKTDTLVDVTDEVARAAEAAKAGDVEAARAALEEARAKTALAGTAPEHIIQFFRWEHLPAPLAEVSKPFGELAHQLVRDLPRNPERTVALRKLLEAKDAAVRARVAKDALPAG